jgi:hypothetical protein
MPPYQTIQVHNLRRRGRGACVVETGDGEANLPLPSQISGEPTCQLCPK